MSKDKEVPSCVHMVAVEVVNKTWCKDKLGYEDEGTREEIVEFTFGKEDNCLKLFKNVTKMGMMQLIVGMIRAYIMEKVTTLATVEIEKMKVAHTVMVEELWNEFGPLLSQSNVES